MNTRQTRQYNSIQDCSAALAQSAFRHPQIDALAARFTAAAHELRELYLAQAIAHQSRTADGGQLRRMRQDVRQRLLRITRHAVAVLDGLPGIRDDVRLPRANVSDQELVKAAGRIVKNLRPHVRELHDTGLPKDAIRRLESAVKALKAKAANPDTAIARRSRATASIPSAIRRARVLAKALDSAIKAELEAKAVFAWERSYRIPGRIGRPKRKRAARSVIPS